MAEKKKIAAQFAPRYRKAGKSEKSRILDEYLALSGAKSRKHVIFKLNRIGKTQLRLLDGQSVTVAIVEKSRKKRACQPSYDAAVADMLELLWKNFDLIRLRETYRMSDTVAAISPGAIDRLQRTTKQRMKLRGTSGTTPVRLLHRAIPIVTGFQYAQKPSGCFQIDLVPHDCGYPSGDCGNFVSDATSSP